MIESEIAPGTMLVGREGTILDPVIVRDANPAEVTVRSPKGMWTVPRFEIEMRLEAGELHVVSQLGEA